MTAIALAPTGASARPVHRIANIVRLNLANPFTVLYTPLIVLGAIFAANWAIWGLIAWGTGGTDATAAASEGLQFSGATIWVFVYMMVVAIQAMNLTFPLALGFGATRREFYLGSVATFTVLAAAYTVGYIALNALERATGGWGLGGTMFDAIYFGLPGDSLLPRALHVFLAFLFFFFIGTAIAAVYVRYRVRGLLAVTFIVAALLIGAAALITFTQSWGALGEFFSGAGFTGVYLLSLVVTVLAGLAGWLVMRRATPRS